MNGDKGTNVEKKAFKQYPKLNHINKAVFRPKDGVDVLGKSPTLYRLESLGDFLQKSEKEWMQMMPKNGRTMRGLVEGLEGIFEPLIQISLNQRGVP